VAELTATYRLQMNAGFTLAMTRARVDYFAQLGISHLYLSPVLAARRRSMHGYDVVDPAKINPEIGDEPTLRALAADLTVRDMGIILDIVPNHMGIGAENAYWEDVLSNGERSRYARWFDIDWASGGNKVVLPVLGDELDRVLEGGELRVRVAAGERPRVMYFAHSFPLDPATLPPELQLATFDAEETGELADLFSGVSGRDRLHELLAEQHYRLTFWRRASNEINYRRFFDVNDLAALRVEDEQVFDETHAFVLRLVRDGVVSGLRVDHIDGLLDPLAYLRRLRDAVGGATPIFVEKILSAGETLRTSWPIQGTTGYDFLNDVNDLFVDPAGFSRIESEYRHSRRQEAKSFHDFAREGKERFLCGSLGADVHRLVRRLMTIAKSAERKWSESDIERALIEFMTALPVYRTYIDGHSDIDDADRRLVERARQEAIEHDAALAEQIAFIADLMLDSLPGVDAAARLAFVMRMQQVTGPATAKGVEDTALYVYHPLASRNEVGGSPDRPLACALSRFHESNARRAESWPLSLTATNTHDTKRSADVRARLDVLSEMPAEWERSVRRWQKLNARHRRVVAGRVAPDANAEYLFYQILIALWPAPRAGRRSDDLPERSWRTNTRERLEQYMLKAAHEAKVRTTWTEPNAEYESALRAFVCGVLEPSEDAPFLTDVARFVSRIALAGAWNSLARVAIHLTAPGTPDTYQGDELWNYTLVDPDNRRPVDFDARAAALDQSSGLAGWDALDGRTKLRLLQRLLHFRRDRAELFTRGSYAALETAGAQSEHVVAFVRSVGDSHVVTIAPRLVCSLLQHGDGASAWGDTRVILPRQLAGRAGRCVLDSNDAAACDTLELGTLLRTIPVAVLEY
jgi:(1->4)-alpha-D-glucan 1-alpha-D-glucosylmutase